MNRYQRATLSAVLLTGIVAGVSTPADAALCTIHGTNGDDVITGTGGPDIICGLGGNDIIHALGGNDIVFGGPGDDEIHGGTGDDRLWGKEGNDTIYGDKGNDKIGGDKGDDVLYGGAGADKMFGKQGNDRMFGDLGPDRMFGGDGEDHLNGGIDTNNGAQQTDFSPNHLGGGAGWDSLTGAKGDDTMYFGTDGGRAFGDDGNDHIVGPTSTSTPDNHVAMWGGKGDDILVANKAGSGSGRVVEGLGDPVLGGPIASYFNGGGGYDIVYGSAHDDYFVTIFGVTRAGDGHDTLVEVGGKVFGGRGNDDIVGRNSDDELVGGPGDDNLFGARGADVLRGGPGADEIGGADAFLSDGGNTIWTGTDKDVDIVWAVESDSCYAAAADTVNGVCNR